MKIKITNIGSIATWSPIENKFIIIKDVEILCGDQSDHNFLTEVVEKFKNFDVIIDDGSHVSKHIIASFNFLFK